MKIYLARPISGLGYEEIVNYYNQVMETLQGVGYTTLCPMTGKNYLRNEIELKAHGITMSPVSTNHAIIERDRWMVHSSDIVYVNLMGAKNVSIGCMMELAWAHELGKHSIVAMEEDNIHRHAFVIEAADIEFRSHEEAIQYLTTLAEGRI